MLLESESKQISIPRLSEEIQNFLSHGEDVINFVRSYGSPLHVVFPDQATKNVSRWKRKLENTYPKVSVRYALKACKSRALTMAFSIAGAGADVASSEELSEAQNCYVASNRISMTGPDKPDHELALCASHGLEVHIDSADELTRFLEIRKYFDNEGKDIKQTILLRLSPKSTALSRFGMSSEEIKDCAIKVNGVDNLALGISFHINDYKVNTRVKVLEECMELTKELLEFEVVISKIDIGGGYPVNYMDSFSTEDYSKGDFWGKRNMSVTYPYSSNLSAEDHAISVLSRSLESKEISNLLTLNSIDIVLEPGRSLLDQCGISIFQVIGVKSVAHNKRIAILNGTSFSLSESWFGSDFAPEPLIIRAGSEKPEENELSYYFAGRSCLEQDMIRCRAVQHLVPITAGDLVVFCNTAGYQMDSNESSFHRIPLPNKVTARKRKGKWIVNLDSESSIEWSYNG
jgi:diaminopimelate decarboxylase